MLGQFPLCFGYWKRWADLELRINGVDPSRPVKPSLRSIIPGLKVLSNGLEHIPACIDLWVHLINILTSSCPPYKNGLDDPEILENEKPDIISLRNLINNLTESTKPFPIPDKMPLYVGYDSASPYPQAQALSRSQLLKSSSLAPLVRQTVESALWAAGNDFHGLNLWDKAVSFERSQQEWVLASFLLARVVRVSVDGADRLVRNQFNRLVVEARSGDVSLVDLVSADELPAVRDFIAVLDSKSATREAEDEERKRQSETAAMELEDLFGAHMRLQEKSYPNFFKSEHLSEEPAVRLRRVARLREQVLSLTAAAREEEAQRISNETSRKQGQRNKLLVEFVSTLREAWWRQHSKDLEMRRSFEKKITRPFFHTAPLPPQELAVWRDYLNFEVTNAANEDLVRSQTLFRRALVTCAALPEFWQRFVSFVEINLANPAAAVKFLQDSLVANPCLPEGQILPVLADVHEASGNIDAAVNILANALAAIQTRAANLEGRQVSQTLHAIDERVLLQKTGILRRGGRIQEAREAFKDACDKAAQRYLEVRQAFEHSQKVRTATEKLQLLKDAQLAQTSITTTNAATALSPEQNSVLSEAVQHPELFKELQSLQISHQQLISQPEGAMFALPAARLSKETTAAVDGLVRLYFEFAEFELLVTGEGEAGSQLLDELIEHLQTPSNDNQDVDMTSPPKNVHDVHQQESLVDWRIVARRIEWEVRTTGPGPMQVVRVENIFSRVFGDDTKEKKIFNMKKICVGILGLGELSARRIAYLRRCAASLEDVRKAERCGREAVRLLDRPDVVGLLGSKRTKLSG